MSSSSGLLGIIRRSSNAMGTFTEDLKIKANNSAHMATPGYKAIKDSFKTVFNEMVNSGFAGDSNVGAKNPEQYGSGVAMGNISLDFSQGALGEGGPLDCAIAGRGLFMVTPDGGRTIYYTRSGEFNIDATGQYIVDSSGRQLLGTQPGNQGGALEPIQTNGNTDIGWATNGVLVSNYQAEKDGNGTVEPLAQVVLADFANVEGLAQYDGTAFVETPASGEPIKENFATFEGLGTIEPQQLEKSNVFYIGEAIDAIETQRAMNAQTSSIKIASDMISNVMNKLLG